MTERRRSLASDLTAQGKWQAEHGAKPDSIVALDDGDTWTLAEGCRLIVPTSEHGEALSRGDMRVKDVLALAEYNVDALPELVRALRYCLEYLQAYARGPKYFRANIAEAELEDGYIPVARRIKAGTAALDAAIEHERGYGVT